MEVARGMVDAVNRLDIDPLVALVRPDVEWDDTEGFPGIRGVYRGRAGMREWWDRAWYFLWLVDGEIARWKLFWARGDARKAAGLRE